MRIRRSIEARGKRNKMKRVSEKVRVWGKRKVKGREKGK